MTPRAAFGVTPWKGGGTSGLAKPVPRCLWSGSSQALRPCFSAKASSQQHHQRTSTALGWSCLNKGHHFLFLHQPAQHTPFEHRCAPR